MSTQASNAPGRVAILDPLRGVAALSVMWFHLTNGGGLFGDASPLSRAFKASGHYGWAGVEMFLVISGFVLPYALDRGGYRLRDYGTFWLKRLLRLEPPYLASIALTLLLWALGSLAPAFHGVPFTLEGRRLLLHLGYLNHYFGQESYNPVYWTLAIELQFYLSIALLFPLLTARNAILRLTVPLAFLALAWVPVEGVFLFKYLPLFVLGILAYQARARSIAAPLHGLLTGVALLATSFRAGLPATLAGALAAACITLFAVHGAAPSLERRRWMRALTWAGSVSYSLYLVHVPVGGRVVNLGVRLAGNGASRVGVLLGAVGASFLAAWALHRFVERPSQRLSAALSFQGKQP